jgi:hypothetical protein
VALVIVSTTASNKSKHFVTFCADQALSLSILCCVNKRRWRKRLYQANKEEIEEEVNLTLQTPVVLMAVVVVVWRR